MNVIMHACSNNKNNEKSSIFGLRMILWQFIGKRKKRDDRSFNIEMIKIIINFSSSSFSPSYEYK